MYIFLLFPLFSRHPKVYNMNLCISFQKPDTSLCFWQIIVGQSYGTVYFINLSEKQKYSGIPHPEVYCVQYYNKIVPDTLTQISDFLSSSMQDLQIFLSL